MSGTLIGLLVGGLALIAFVAVLVMWLRRGTATAKAKLEEIAGGRTPTLQSAASSFGIKSKGSTQLRGLGYMALFEDELVFVQVFARNHVRAAVKDLVAVTTPRSFLGKTTGRRLLAIEWRTETGATDQFAVTVANLDVWLAALSRIGLAAVEGA